MGAWSDQRWGYSRGAVHRSQRPPPDPPPARASAARHRSRTHRTATALADRSPDPYIDQIALDFPELSIVCGHIGYPRTEEMIAVARKHPGVSIDTSAYTTKRQPAELVST